MHSFIFKSLIKKLHPHLYVKEGGIISSIMLSRPKRSDKKSDYNYLSDKAGRQMLEAQESGMVDDHICGCPSQWIPEWDEFDLENGRMLKRGWRTILKVLVEQKIVTLARAKRVFNCPSLLEADFDRLSFDGKVRRLRAEQKRG